MNYFLLETQGNNGKQFLKTNASTKEQAIKNFCNLYLAPSNSVINVYQFDLMWWNFAPKTMINKNLVTKV